MKSAGGSDRAGALTEGTAAEYWFAGKPTPVTLLRFTHSGQPLIAFADGRLEVVRLDRVRIRLEQLA